MKFCDDCKWCSLNFVPSEEERKYNMPALETKNSQFYTCMHPLSSKGVRFECSYCSTMRLNSKACKESALLFEKA